MAARRTNNARPDPVVYYAPVRVLRVYEISEGELEQLASGPQGQIHLNFALALLPASLTVFITVQTVEIQDIRIYAGYWIAFWLLFVQGAISLVRWWTVGRSTHSLVDTIRLRMPPPPGTPDLPGIPAPGTEIETKEP